MKIKLPDSWMDLSNFLFWMLLMGSSTEAIPYIKTNEASSLLENIDIIILKSAWIYHRFPIRIVVIKQTNIISGWKSRSY